MKKLFVIILTTCTLGLAGCGTLSTDNYNGDFSGIPAKQLFHRGENALADSDYERAAKYFEGVNTLYPFSDFSQQAQLNLIYAHYMHGDFASTAAAAEHYIHLYPRSKDVDYAHYMKGVAKFEQDRAVFTKYLPVDRSLRDLKNAHEAYRDFAILIKYFPNSQYLGDAQQRMIYLRNLFAQRELHVATFYYEHQAFVAAANRASTLIKTYNQAPQVEQALVILVKANRKLGLKKEEDNALKVLRLNYPHNSLVS